jgi:hypothetical protein
MPRSSTKTVTKKTAKRAAKKTAKKTTKRVAKKTTKRAAKKPTKKANNEQRVLVCANGENCFWVSDGAILASLEDLATALESMHKDIFTYHAKGSSNDFADWVEQVLFDEACATDLRKSRSQSGAYKVVIRHLRYYA